MRLPTTAPLLLAAALLASACGAPNTQAPEDAGTDELPYDAGSEVDAGVPVASVAVKPDPELVCLNGCLNFTAGQSRQFVAEVKDAAGELIEGVDVQWSSGDESLATVDAMGLVQTKAVGSVAILATAGGVTGQVTIHIAPARVAKITVTPNPSTASIGATTQLTATAEDDFGNVLTDVVFEWSSANPLVATVDQNGLVTGVRGGHTVIFASSDRGFGSGWASVEIISAAAQPAGFALAALSLGSHHGCGLAGGGKPYCWGWNYFGQMGVGRLDEATASFPVPEPVLTTETFEEVEMGATHSCALTSTGAAWCWGLNDMGQLGTHATWMEVGGTTEPYPVLGMLSFKKLGAGQTHTCGIASDDTLYCWGMGSDGALGVGDFNHRMTPTAVQSTLDFKDVVAGLASTCALAADGKAWCWGRNGQGQLGTQEAPSDQIVREEPKEVWGGMVFEKLALTASHVCALDAMGAAWCWGNNTFGQVGDGTLQTRAAPTQVVTSQRFVDLEVGAHHSCGLTAGGDVYCWGNNDSGQLGDGSLQGQLAPVKVIGPHKFATLDSRANVTCGITTDNEAMCWGSAYTGESAGGISGGMFVAPWPVSEPLTTGE